MFSKRKNEHNWNEIYRRKGKVFIEPLEEVKEFSRDLLNLGLTRILDLGCGNGRHIIFLKEKGFDVWGMDNAPEGLRLAREWLAKAKLSVPLLLADVHEPFPFAGDSFDGLISTRVIHHGTKEKVLGAMQEVIRVVRKDGMILITVPGDTERRNRFAWFGRRAPIKWIEPRTYIPLRGPERGIPHYAFLPEELAGLFAEFSMVNIERGKRNSILLKAKK